MMACMRHHIVALGATVVLAVAAAVAQPLLPRCSAEFDGQVASGGCVCRHESGGQLTGRAPGWRWGCDLLRGPGVMEEVPPAGLPPPSLPRGFTYAPQSGGSAVTGTGTGTGMGTGSRAMGY